MGQYRFREKGGSVGWLSRKPKQRQDEPLIAAAAWAESLRRGGVPEPVQAPILLGEGERAYARIPVSVDHFAAADAIYTQGFLLAGGSVAGLAATAIGSAMFNASARSKAQAAASPQWRAVDTGELFLTNQRMAVRGNQGFWEYWYPGIQSVEQDPAGMVLWTREMATTRLRVTVPEWLAVAYAWFAHGVAAEIPLDDDQRAEVNRRLDTLTLTV
jgi:hypothetical protein